MLPYKKYCNRRAAQKGQETEETHCCPSRMPIIGPILFSLFIFSPFILPSSDTDKSSELETDSIAKESLLPYDEPLLILKDSDSDKQVSLPE